MGRASNVALIPTLSRLGGSFAPMENSPPGIQTIPMGEDPGACKRFSMVASNSIGRELTFRPASVDGCGFEDAPLAVSEECPREARYPHDAANAISAAAAGIRMLFRFPASMCAVADCAGLILC